MSPQSRTNNVNGPSSSTTGDQVGNKSVMWQSVQSGKQMSPKEADRKGGDVSRGNKKSDQSYGKRRPESGSSGMSPMDRFMKEGQGPGGAAPWVATWTFKTAGGVQQK